MPTDRSRFRPSPSSRRSSWIKQRVNRGKSLRSPLLFPHRGVGISVTRRFLCVYFHIISFRCRVDRWSRNEKTIPEGGMVSNIHRTHYRMSDFTFPTRSSFGTAYRKRPNGLSHIEQTLKPGVLGQPLGRTSFEVSGQWPVCFAGASPTEDPSLRDN